MDSVSTLILGIALIVIMLGMGLSLVPSDFKRIFVKPKAIVLGLINQLIFLPLIGFLLASILPLEPAIAIGIMILAACPGGPTSNLISHLAKADVALSVSLTALSSFITILTIPFIVNFALVEFASEGKIVPLDIPDTIKKILMITVIPVGVGMLVRHYYSNFAERMAKPVRIASGALLALIIIGLVIKQKDVFVDYFQQAGLVALLLNVITMALGYFSAKLFKLNILQARSISIESGIQNGTLAITVAAVLLENESYAIAPAVYSLIMFGTGGVLIYMALRKDKQSNM
ncbi:bile acid:sodium symporter family protein [bacterium]|nr:bile acid:sodium symporter family protein [bacterium]